MVARHRQLPDCSSPGSAERGSAKRSSEAAGAGNVSGELFAQIQRLLEPYRLPHLDLFAPFERGVMRRPWCATHHTLDAAPAGEWINPDRLLRDVAGPLELLLAGLQLKFGTVLIRVRRGEVTAVQTQSTFLAKDHQQSSEAV